MKGVLISGIFCSNYPYIGKVFDIGKVVVVSDFQVYSSKYTISYAENIMA
jgi:hypothetical protein